MPNIEMLTDSISQRYTETQNCQKPFFNQRQNAYDPLQLYKDTGKLAVLKIFLENQQIHIE